MSLGYKGVVPQLQCGVSRTKQAFRDMVNINSIMKRYSKSGMVSHVNGRTPFYGDVSEVAAYQDALGIVARARDLFAGMSSDIRDRFAYDPLRMIEFLQDPKNLDEAVRLGMVVKRPVAPVAPVSDPVKVSEPPKP